MSTPMKWFMALNESSSSFAAYSDMVRVAVLTARQHTDLQPYLLYDGIANELTDWLCSHGVEVIYCRTRFYDDLAVLAKSENRPGIMNIGPGALLRIDLPKLAKEHGIEDTFVLYTDCDVMFTGPVTELDEVKPKYFAAAPQATELDYSDMNTGVMIMNLPSLLEEDGDFTRFTIDRLAEYSRTSWDQMAYRQYYRSSHDGSFRWDKLSPVYNWKPYWGLSDRASIVHFHGPKPFQRKAAETGKLTQLASHLMEGGYKEYCQLWEENLAIAK